MTVHVRSKEFILHEKNACVRTVSEERGMAQLHASEYSLLEVMASKFFTYRKNVEM